MKFRISLYKNLYALPRLPEGNKIKTKSPGPIFNISFSEILILSEAVVKTAS